MVGITFDVFKRSFEETSDDGLEELEIEAGRACEGLIRVIGENRQGDDLSQDAEDGVSIFGWTAQALMRLKIYDLANPARLPSQASPSITETLERVSDRRDLLWATPINPCIVKGAVLALEVSLRCAISQVDHAQAHKRNLENLKKEFGDQGGLGAIAKPRAVTSDAFKMESPHRAALGPPSSS